MYENVNFVFIQGLFDTVCSKYLYIRSVISYFGIFVLNTGFYL